ncbi:MAG: hypothetical protein ACJAWL_001297 [Motiliproteus sp.]|jgi:hypothetical protein
MAIANLWSMNEDDKKLSHQSGLLFKIDGDINDPMGIDPLVIPSHFGSLDLAALIREGVEYCREYQVAVQSRPILSVSKAGAQRAFDSSATGINIS